MQAKYFHDIGKTSSIKERVYENIKYLIIKGKLKPGERLIEKELSDLMNVSRGPIREAMNRFDIEGFIDILPRKGARVHIVNQQEVDDTFHLFRMLFYELVVGALKKIDQSDINNFIQKLKKIDNNDKVIDDFLSRKIKYDQELNKFLWKKNGNDRLFEMLGFVHEKIHWYRSISQIDRPAQNSIFYRKEILKAIRSKNKRKIYNVLLLNTKESIKYAVIQIS